MQGEFHSLWGFCGFLAFYNFFSFYIFFFYVIDIMVFGLLSLLMGHWTVWISHICIKETAVSNEFYPCLKNAYVNNSHSSRFWEIEKHGSCPQVNL